MLKPHDDADGNKKETDVEQQVVDPALQCSLKRDSVNYKILKVLKGHQGQAASNLVNN